MAAGYDGTIRIDSKINTENFNKGISSVEKGLSSVSGSLKKLAGSVGIAFGVSALIKFGKEAINIASDVDEVQNVVDTAFGSMSYMVEAFADTAIEKFGMSRLAAKQTASTYMAMNRGMGLYSKEAAQMAIDAAARTGDVASFFNTSQKEADTMLKSIWTGETESLKRIGVVMTQTNLDAFALRHGFGKTTAAMSQQELVMLRYKYVMEQTGLAAGDFEKTQDSWANQTRILTQRWGQFLGVMGKSLIQVLNPAVKLLNQLMASLIRFAETFSKFTAELFGEQELKINTAPLQDAADAQNEYADATENAQKAQNKFIAGLDEITTLNEQESASAVAPFLSSTSGDKKNDKKDEEEQKENKLKKLLTSFKSFFKQFSPEIDGAISNIKQQLEKFKKTLERIWQDIKILGNPLKSWFSSDFTSFLKTSISSVGTILSGLLDSAEMVFSGLWDIVIFPSLVTVETKALPFFTQLGEKYVHALSTAFSAIKPVFDEVWETGVEPALSKMQAMWSETWDLLYEKWELYGGPIFEGLEEAFGNCAEFLSTWWNSFLKPIWDEFMHVVDWLWTEHLKPFVDQFLEFVAKLATGALEIYNKVIAPVVKWIIEYLYPPIARTVGFIINLIGSVIASVLDFGKGILRALSGIIDFIVGVFTGDWSRAWSGIKETVAGIMDAIGGLFRGGVNILIDILNFFIKNAISAINSVINSINKISFKAPDWVPKIGGQEIGFNIKSLPNYQIPKLATGAVIPPNAEFAAILGDQKHGRNLEAPESLLRQIAREESGGDVTVIVQLPSGEQKKVYSTKDINKRNRQSGKILIPVEVD